MCHRTTALIMVITIFVITIFSVQARGEGGGAETEQVFGFAESLYEEGDYFRAIGEYKRYIYLSPTDKHGPAENRIEKAAFRIVEGYYQAKRWSEAIAASNQFLKKYPSSLRYYEMLYFKGRLENISGNSDDAIRTFDLIVISNEPTYSDRAQYQKALVMLERSDWRGAGKALRLIPQASQLLPSASALAMEIEKKEELSRKSPTTAGILAAVLPGAGHLYVERPRDALVAFLLNGAFIWGAAELFHHDNYVAGGILAFFELGWYSGNIYSAVSSAHKYNRDKENEFIKKLKNRFSLAYYHEGGDQGIVISHRF